MAELDRVAKQQAANAEETLKQLGLEEKVDTVKKEIAIKLSTLRERYAASQRQRITLLRSLSAVIGIVLAFALQIDTFTILGSFFSADILAALNTQWGHFGGMILTGLASSAGSSFWHDMLGRVRNIKDTVKQVEVAVEGVKS